VLNKNVEMHTGKDMNNYLNYDLHFVMIYFEKLDVKEYF
jgi:hypothetical protein